MPRARGRSCALKRLRDSSIKVFKSAAAAAESKMAIIMPRISSDIEWVAISRIKCTVTLYITTLP